MSSFNQGSPGCTSLQHSLLHTIIHTCDPLPTSRLLRESATLSQWTGGPMVSSAMKWSLDRWAQFWYSLLNKTWYINRKEDCKCIGGLMRLSPTYLVSIQWWWWGWAVWLHLQLSSLLLQISGLTHGQLPWQGTVSLFKHHACTNICNDHNCNLNCTIPLHQPTYSYSQD